MEGKLDNDSDFMTIEKICDNILVKYDQMNKESREKISRHDEKLTLRKIPIQGNLCNL